MKLNEYVTLGRTGLRVSPLCLGTMTFGTEWGWGSDEATAARRSSKQYLETGGNFVDTADGYTNGKSEELVGNLSRKRNRATAWCWPRNLPSTPSPEIPTRAETAGKTFIAPSRGSLRRLQTDYIDLYWMHAWDTITPSKKFWPRLTRWCSPARSATIGFSDVPAWYVARAQTLAELQGRERVARAATGVFADRAQHRARARARRAGVGHRHLSRGARWQAACCRANIRTRRRLGLEGAHRIRREQQEIPSSIAHRTEFEDCR